MRKTAKYLAAKDRIKELGLRPGKRRENADIYELLENNKQIWDHKAGKWVEGTKSMFGDDEPSGIVRLRVTAHGAEVYRAVKLIEEGLQVKVIEVSKQYPNRHSTGVRVYLTCLMEDES